MGLEPNQLGGGFPLLPSKRSGKPPNSPAEPGLPNPNQSAGPELQLKNFQPPKREASPGREVLTVRVDLPGRRKPPHLQAFGFKRGPSLAPPQKKKHKSCGWLRSPFAPPNETWLKSEGVLAVLVFSGESNPSRVSGRCCEMGFATIRSVSKTSPQVGFRWQQKEDARTCYRGQVQRSLTQVETSYPQFWNKGLPVGSMAMLTVKQSRFGLGRRGLRKVGLLAHGACFAFLRGEHR